MAIQCISGNLDVHQSDPVTAPLCEGCEVIKDINIMGMKMRRFTSTGGNHSLSSGDVFWSSLLPSLEHVCFVRQLRVVSHR